MARRRCIDCPTLIDAGQTRCDNHRRSKDKARGTRQERGYDAAYEQQLRTPEYLNATHCAGCGEAFTPDNPKTGGHSVALRRGGRGSRVVAHCRRCNYGWMRTDL